MKKTHRDLLSLKNVLAGFKTVMSENYNYHWLGAYRGKLESMIHHHVETRDDNYDKYQVGIYIAGLQLKEEGKI